MRRLSRVGYVRLDEDGAVAPGHAVESLGRRRSDRLVQVCHDDIGSLLDQAAGDALAEALSGSGHDDRLVLDASRCAARADLAAIIFHFPVVDEVDLALGHRVLASERLGDRGDLHHVLVHVQNNVAACGVVADRHQADTLDEQHLRRIAVRCDVLLDLRLGLLEQRLLIGGGEIDVFRLAVDDRVGREGRRNFRIFAFGRSITLDQRVVADAERLDSLLAEHHADSREHFLHAVAYRLVAFGQRYAGRLLDRREHAVVNGLDLGRRVGADEDAVILQQQNGGFLAEFGLVGFDPVVHFLEQHVSRIGIRDIYGLVAEQAGRFGLGVLSAHQAVDHRRMQMDDERGAQCVVHRGLDRRAAVLRDACGRQVVLDFLLARGRIRRVGFFRDDVQFLAVQHGEAVFGDRRQRASAGLDPQLVGILVRGVAASRDHVAAVAAVLARYFDQLFYLFHFLFGC